MGLEASQESATECEEHARPQGGEAASDFSLCGTVKREREKRIKFCRLKVLSKWIRPPGSTMVRSPFHVSRDLILN
jgi:hypothetical protein